MRFGFMLSRVDLRIKCWKMVKVYQSVINQGYISLSLEVRGKYIQYTEYTQLFRSGHADS